jgi:hypothetical protein
MEYKDLKKLAVVACTADKTNPVAYSFGEEKYTIEDVNNALRVEFEKLAPKGDYYTYEENKNTIFRLITETIDEVLPARVLDQYARFADIQHIAQGEKAIFRTRITEASKRRAKAFVTRVGLAGRYETFMLDGNETEVKTGAIGAAARIGFEEFLDGRWQFSDFTTLVLEGIDEYIYKEIAKELASMISALPTSNKYSGSGFSEQDMDELLAIADAYGHSAIYCTFEFASKMIPNQNWASGDMKNRLWEQGYLGNYKGHDVIILPQSIDFDYTLNDRKAIDPSKAYIIPTGVEKPIKVVFEGSTQVREVEDNDDWSRDMQTYTKVGVAVLTQQYWVCSYENTDLTFSTR